MVEDLINKMAEVTHRFRAQLQSGRALQQVDLSGFEAATLVAIGRRPGCSAQQLASRSGRDKAQVARALKALEGRHLIARTPDPDDRRRALLTLTDTGRDAWDVLLAHRRTLGAALLSELSEEEQQILSRLYDRMRSALLRMEADEL